MPESFKLPTKPNKAKSKMEEKPMDELEAQMRMAQILNDSPVEITVAGEKMRITALKPGTEALIAEESVRIQQAEKGNMVDLMKQMAKVQPSVAKCLALAILNDRKRIFKDDHCQDFTDEYHALYDKILWESDKQEWMTALLGIFRLLNLDFFFRITDSVQSFRQMMLEKRTQEQSLSMPAPPGGEW